jgi:hypothetical protein
MLKLLAGLMLGFAVLVQPVGQAEAARKNPPQYICHWQEKDMNGDGVIDPFEGEYKLLKLDAHGAANHLKNHTGRTDQPDDFTATADTNCNAV